MAKSYLVISAYALLLLGYALFCYKMNSRLYECNTSSLCGIYTSLEPLQHAQDKMAVFGTGTAFLGVLIALIALVKVGAEWIYVFKIAQNSEYGHNKLEQIGHNLWSKLFHLVVLGHVFWIFFQGMHLAVFRLKCKVFPPNESSGWSSGLFFPDQTGNGLEFMMVYLNAMMAVKHVSLCLFVAVAVYAVVFLLYRLYSQFYSRL